ncbi:MAG: GTPase ObgE [Clostridia bacterium]|nr:GTPase ObgE [Clostridia bacterium]
MFTDKAKIYIKAGNGGHGSMSFHREKYVAAGGPDGGDGGKGGSVIFITDNNLSTLLDFKYKKKYVAENGRDGSSARCNGKSGENLYIKVPVGTIIKQDGKVIADLNSKDSEFVAAKGGNGGWGNCHFATATRQAPKFAKLGLEGEEKELELELKLLADVGLVGFPNVGKSTLLSVISDAKPKIANYHFTTLVPNLGVVNAGEGESFVVADIPGLIEGASQGLGLGHEFLRHVERTRLLIHVVDVSGIEGRNPIEDFDTINNELKSYNADLESRLQIVAANKTDIITDQKMYDDFKTEIENRGYKLFEISAATKSGVRELISYAGSCLKDIPIPEFEIEKPETKIYTYEKETPFTVTNDNGVYVVEGDYIKKLLGSCNFEDYESLSYFQNSLRKNGVIKALEDKGIKEGDMVRMYELEFEFIY